MCYLIPSLNLVVHLKLTDYPCARAGLGMVVTEKEVSVGPSTNFEIGL